MNRKKNKERNKKKKGKLYKKGRGKWGAEEIKANLTKDTKWGER